MQLLKLTLRLCSTALHCCAADACPSSCFCPHPVASLLQLLTLHLPSASSRQSNSIPSVRLPLLQLLLLRLSTPTSPTSSCWSLRFSNYGIKHYL